MPDGTKPMPLSILTQTSVTIWHHYGAINQSIPKIKPKCFETVSVHHDDVIKWNHFPRGWPFVRGIHRSPVNSPLKGQWRGALMFSLICAWINDWVNNRKAGDLRLHCAHYDVIVVSFFAVVFLVAYFIFLIFLGLPLLYLELHLGQFSSQGILSCWGFAPVATGNINQHHILSVASYKSRERKLHGFLFPSLVCSLCCVKIIRYIAGRRSYSFVCTLPNFTVIIMQTYLRALDI